MDYSVSFVRDYCSFINRFGISNGESFEVLGMSSLKMNVPFLRVKADDVNRLFSFAIERSRDDNIGIKLPCEQSYVPDKVIYMLIWNSRTPLEAMRTACKYVKLITTTFSAVFSEDESTFSIEFIPSSQWFRYRDRWDPLIKTTLDVSVSTVQNTFPKMFGKELHPLELRMTIETPKVVEPYYDLFKCPIYFGDRRNLIVYDKSVLRKEKNAYYDKKTYDSIVRYADEVIRHQISQNDGFAIIVESEILASVGSGFGFPNIVTIARSLSMSVRSFQRKLDSEGLSYREILDNARRDFATNFLAGHPDSNLGELSDALGYSDASAFIKAFKRWHGTSPGKYRGASGRSSSSGDD